MEHPNNWSMVELESPSDDDFIYPNNAAPKGGRNKNAKQLTWVLLLKAHRAAGCLASIAAAFLSLTSIVRRRVTSGRTDSTDNPRAAVNSRFYLCIKAFLWLSLLLLGFEVAAYFKGWHFGHPDLQLQHLYTLADAATVRTAFEYEFVAIFYADFQPNPDFLMKTIPHFKDNEEVGLVQARWSFVNKDENLLTRLQLINLAFHFEVEQQVNGIFLNFRLQWDCVDMED